METSVLKKTPNTFVLLSVKQFGARGDGLTNDGPAIQRVLNAADGKCLVFPKGKYVVRGDKGLLAAGKSIDILFEPGAVIDATNCTAETVFDIFGSAGNFYPLPTDVVEFERKLEVSASLASVLSEGDLIKITTDPDKGGSDERWNWAKRRSYYKGEIVEVLSVSGNIVTLKSPLNDDYKKRGTVAAKIDYVSGSLTNFRMECGLSNDGKGVRTTYTKNYRVEGGEIRGVGDGCLLNSNAFNFRVEGFTASNFLGAKGDGYGLTFGSGSTKCTVDSCILYGGTHAFSLGGYEPNRWITVSNCILDSAHSPGQNLNSKACLATHENAQYVKIIGNQIKNGICMTCLDFELIDNTVYTHLSSYPIQIVAAEAGRDARYMTVQGNTAYAGVSNNNPGLVFQADSAFTIERLKIVNNIIRGFSDGIIIKQTTDALLALGSVQISDNLIEGPNAVGIRIMKGSAGDDPAFNMTCKSLDMLNNQISAGSYALVIENLTCPIAKFNNNNFHCVHPSRSLFLSVMTDIHTFFCQNNSFRADYSHAPDSGKTPPEPSQDRPVRLDGMELIVCTGNTINKTHAYAGFQLKATNILFSNNNLLNIHGAKVSLRGRHYYRIFGNGNVESYGTKAPDTGNWKQGDRVYNTNAGPGQKIGWVCINEDPLEWKAFGLIDNE